MKQKQIISKKKESDKNKELKESKRERQEGRKKEKKKRDRERESEKGEGPKRLRRNKGRHSKINKNTLFRGKTVFLLKAKKGKKGGSRAK